jgi:hypothetical protein
MNTTMAIAMTSFIAPLCQVFPDTSCRVAVAPMVTRALAQNGRSARHPLAHAPHMPVHIPLSLIWINRSAPGPAIRRRWNLTNIFRASQRNTRADTTN